MVKIFFIIIMLFSSLSYAEMYYWTDGNGVKHFTNTPPEGSIDNIEKIKEYAYTENEEIKIEQNESVKKPKNTYRKEPVKKQEKFKQSQEVVMYSTPRCGYCRRAKAFFNKHDVKFTDYNVASSKDAKKKFKALNGKGVPLIFIGDKRIVGFDKPIIKNALGIR